MPPHAFLRLQSVSLLTEMAQNMERSRGSDFDSGLGPLLKRLKGIVPPAQL